ncbi:Predicted O-linked N-acetylglucosamine transferase, SPINDLY family [Bryocella elongata]|uniref:protein O-GlcNAc transferase n=1 Tax=Bryocella elongata TaxID=863522 RepID=A0A1H6BHR8_9BACT|nr:tetratricopeptide repeat protein [Bryocella elongata]SEG60194.1 Predicted O-linked N-acetylglucosamine transferase, SPINDLY family [Bryocella elongata]
MGFQDKQRSTTEAALPKQMFFTDRSQQRRGAKAPAAPNGIARAAAQADAGQQARFHARMNEGVTHLRAARWREGAASLAAAIEIDPRSADAVSNLGVALYYLGDAERARVCYLKALELNPKLASAHSNLGQALLALGRNSEAASSLIKAVELDPKLTDGWVNLGAALNAIGKHAAAGEASRHALELDPNNLEASLNFGNAFKQEGMLQEAAQCYRRVIALNPRDPRGYNNLGETLRDQGEPNIASRAYEAALAVDPRNPVAFSNLLYLHAFTRDIPAESELALARQFESFLLTAEERNAARAASCPWGGAFPAEPLGAGVARRRLRVGIVSAELGTHAVAEFLEPILATLDRSRFHLTLFPVTGRYCERAARIRELADGFVPLTTLSDAAAVERIRREHIDVLIDTSGHTLNNRLGIFARRAAPVQATYIGYWSTTGLTEMDYFIADQDPPASIEAHFSERFWRLPRIGVCYRGDRDLDLGWQPHPEGKIRMGAFAKFAKIREATLALWAGALKAVPNSVLLLEDRGNAETESHNRIRTGLAVHGIAPERVEFLSYEPGHARHMRMYHQLDIALDTVPFNGGTTSFDALWMGVPTVTVEGQTEGARITGAALNALGHPEWIARDAAEFAGIVAAIARTCTDDNASRTAMRSDLREQMAASQLCDSVSLTHSLEDAFEQMYVRWLNGTEQTRIPAQSAAKPVASTYLGLKRASGF